MGKENVKNTALSTSRLPTHGLSATASSLITLSLHNGALFLILSWAKILKLSPFCQSKQPSFQFIPMRQSKYLLPPMFIPKISSSRKRRFFASKTCYSCALPLGYGWLTPERCELCYEKYRYRGLLQRIGRFLEPSSASEFWSAIFVITGNSKQ